MTIRKFDDDLDHLFSWRQLHHAVCLHIQTLADDLFRRRNQDWVGGLDIQVEGNGCGRDCLTIQANLYHQCVATRGFDRGGIGQRIGMA